MSSIPEVKWQVDDDLCDCPFQRIRWWTNPYLSKTTEIRLCCFYKKLGEMFPELAVFMRDIDMFDDYKKEGKDEGDRYHWTDRVLEWTADSDMPRALWYRQIQTLTGMDLEVIRTTFQNQEPPKAR